MGTIQKTWKGSELMKDFSCCCECGEKLKDVNHKRTRPKLCASCRGDKVGGNSAIRQMFLEMQRNPAPESEYEEQFEDDPVAVKEVDNQKYRRRAPEVSFGGSVLADVIAPSDPNRYRHAHGSATQGYRYTYKKEKPT